MVADQTRGKKIACGQRVTYKWKYDQSDRDGQIAVVIGHRESEEPTSKSGPLHIIQFSDNGQLAAFFDELTPVV